MLDSLDDPRAPSAIYSMLARRKDVSFVRHMLQRFADEVPKTARRNLKRIDSFSWLRDDMNLLSALNGEEQRGVIHLIMASGVSRGRVFEVVDFILTHGAAEGRREAANALTEFHGATADAMVIRALEDDDPLVRANVARQLRERGTQGAMTTLLDLIDSPHTAVHEAALDSLAEFTFERFLATFATLDDETAAETGQFVKRVDRHAIDGLRNELKSPIRVRRTRAVRMAVAMTAVPEVESLIIDLLFDDDNVIRAATAEALRQSPSEASREALRAAILDRSQIVRDAAARTLQDFAEGDLPRCLAPDHPLSLDSSGTEPALETGEALR
jgi:HEAT repeat protein